MKDEPYVHIWIEHSSGREMAMLPAEDYRRLCVRVANLEQELAIRREQIGQALDAIGHTAARREKQFAKSTCVCGVMISNSGRAATSHLRGTVHRQNMERKALGLEPI